MSTHSISEMINGLNKLSCDKTLSKNVRSSLFRTAIRLSDLKDRAILQELWLTEADEGFQNFKHDPTGYSLSKIINSLDHIASILRSIHAELGATMDCADVLLYALKLELPKVEPDEPSSS